MAVKLGRKAFFLTFIAVLMVSFFMLVFSTNLGARVPESSDTSWAKVDTIDRFTKDVRRLYLERALYASSVAAFRSMAEFMRANPALNMTDLQANFSELVQYGTLSGDFQQAMRNMTLANWSDRMANLSYDHLRIVTNITYGNIYLEQTDPWLVTVHAEIFIRTSRRGVNYRIDTTVPLNISIVGLPDPLHYKHGMSRVVRPTNITNWSIDNLRFHMANGMYRRSINNTGPSYLMRFSNNLTNSTCCAIESVLNGSVGFQNRSYIDYKYWNDTTQDKCLLGFEQDPVFFVPGITDTPLGGSGNFSLEGEDFIAYTNYTLASLSNNRCYP